MPTRNRKPARTSFPTKFPLPPPKLYRKYAAAWARWQRAAEMFKGLDERLWSKAELRNISMTRCGYQVRIFRGTGQQTKVLDRSILGHSEESLLEAIRVRDEGLRQWPRLVRTNQIPERVLQALGLSEPVTGVNRLPSRSVYRVHYTDGTGRRRMRQFYFRVVREEVAYAAAIDFLQSLPE